MVWGLLDHLQDQEDHYNHCNSPIKHSFTGVGKYQLIQKELKNIVSAGLLISPSQHVLFYFCFIYFFFPVSLHFLSYILKSYTVAVMKYANTI